ncbi:zinc ribbon domain-containing protein [bacterium]|nr:zinc ribbon domain-containing protein [bacterium]
MPIYVYRCSNCHKEVEKLQHADDAPLTICPDCGQESMHKVVGNVGIVFKGSGFYVTDNPHGSSGEGKQSSKTEK